MTNLNLVQYFNRIIIWNEEALQLHNMLHYHNMLNYSALCWDELLGGGIILQRACTW